MDASPYTRDVLPPSTDRVHWDKTSRPFIGMSRPAVVNRYIDTACGVSMRCLGFNLR
jgi:hypothetical protein